MESTDKITQIKEQFFSNKELEKTYFSKLYHDTEALEEAIILKDKELTYIQACVNFYENKLEKAEKLFTLCEKNNFKLQEVYFYQLMIFKIQNQQNIVEFQFSFVKQMFDKMYKCKNMGQLENIYMRNALEIIFDCYRFYDTIEHQSQYIKYDFFIRDYHFLNHKDLYVGNQFLNEFEYFNVEKFKNKQNQSKIEEKFLEFTNNLQNNHNNNQNYIIFVQSFLAKEWEIVKKYSLLLSQQSLNQSQKEAYQAINYHTYISLQFDDSLKPGFDKEKLQTYELGLVFYVINSYRKFELGAVPEEEDDFSEEMLDFSLKEKADKFETNFPSFYVQLAAYYFLLLEFSLELGLDEQIKQEDVVRNMEDCYNKAMKQNKYDIGTLLSYDFFLQDMKGDQVKSEEIIKQALLGDSCLKNNVYQVRINCLQGQNKTKEIEELYELHMKEQVRSQDLINKYGSYLIEKGQEKKAVQVLSELENKLNKTGVFKDYIVDQANCLMEIKQEKKKKEQNLACQAKNLGMVYSKERKFRKEILVEVLSFLKQGPKK